MRRKKKLSYITLTDDEIKKFNLYLKLYGLDIKKIQKLNESIIESLDTINASLSLLYIGLKTSKQAKRELKHTRKLFDTEEN